MSHVIERGYTLEEGKQAVGIGWHRLVERVFLELATHPALKIVQVKEKFAGLRIYSESIMGYEGELEDEMDAFYHFLDMIELESKETCEDCGKPGKVGGTGWLRTLCEDHRK